MKISADDVVRLVVAGQERLVCGQGWSDVDARVLCRQYNNGYDALGSTLKLIVQDIVNKKSSVRVHTWESCVRTPYGDIDIKAQFFS